MSDNQRGQDVATVGRLLQVAIDTPARSGGSVHAVADLIAAARSQGAERAMRDAQMAVHDELKRTSEDVTPMPFWCRMRVVYWLKNRADAIARGDDA